MARFILSLLLSWSFLIWGTQQLQSSQTQVLLQLRKQLEYPKQLDYWENPGIDLCFASTPQVNITCQDSIVVEINIYGDANTRPPSFHGFPSPPQTLSGNFSMDSLVATLSRLNSLRALTLVSLGIWGPIPVKIHRLHSLESLDLSWNFLFGSVPVTFPRILSLQVLKLDGNFLNGTFPDWINPFSNLTSLSLRANRLEGPLPNSLQKLTSLTDINLSNNVINGKLMDLSGLSRLYWMDLSNNKLDSGLPSLPKGIATVVLSNNSFSGRIPEQYGKLRQLQQLDLSFNALTEVAGIVVLVALPDMALLNLGSNMLTGLLPSRLSCGSKLQLVDISNNRLKGVLPSCLSSNVKNRTVRFGGNCLATDPKHQHPEAYCASAAIIQEKTKPQEKKSVGVLIGVIGGIAVVVVLLAVGFLVFCRQYCPRGTSEQHLLHKAVHDNSVTGYTAEILTSARYISDAAKLGVQGSPAHRPFSLDELKASTNNFDSSALMGQGSTGKIYKGRLDNGTQVAIRCLVVSKKYTIRNLKLRLDLLAKLRHPHLVCFLGHCIENEGKEVSGANNVYLIYEYVPNGDYRAHLSETNPDKVLKWSDRLAILIGIAKAVHFLHTGVIPGFYSNRLKANNILLNEHRIGKLSDYGLSVVAQDIEKDEEKGGAMRSWHAKSLDDDIYSFGIILLESLVGPSVRARNESFLLNEMVSLGNPDGQRRVVDPIVLASCSQESLSIAISLTINCISPESSTRPSFEDVLWNLQYAAQVQATPNVDPKTGKTLVSP
ncbi:probable inactive leucine-rich repeat receptor-like protein kinase At3g03770 [Salvia splendens]|uniref:probable inactive leucine-rich repeat receptor-like protein kinase At3g03770 n=1 Tax=Salvia splendens TaxID=180675 RepID=UPI001C2614B3|nr:probable inactive leucine-rich repeat receptor-like protein kinase At3g03770 [Salvia splendens]XP_042041752.1 probable inactive leucine-rich repeat receptor-like protein kinase At3g03770 [Salvia splendens]